MCNRHAKRGEVLLIPKFTRGRRTRVLCSPSYPPDVVCGDEPKSPLGFARTHRVRVSENFF